MIITTYGKLQFVIPHLKDLLACKIRRIDAVVELNKLRRELTTHSEDIQAGIKSLIENYGTPNEAGEKSIESIHPEYIKLLSIEAEIVLDTIDLGPLSELLQQGESISPDTIYELEESGMVTFG